MPPPSSPPSLKTRVVVTCAAASGEESGAADHVVVPPHDACVSPIDWRGRGLLAFVVDLMRDAAASATSAPRCDYVLGTYGEPSNSTTTTTCGEPACYSPLGDVASGVTRCRSHAPKAWRYAFRPRCIEPSCVSPARYGTRWLRAEHCLLHKTDDDAICVYLCAACGERRAHHGYMWKQPLYCHECVSRLGLSDATLLGLVPDVPPLRVVQSQVCPGAVLWCRGEVTTRCGSLAAAPFADAPRHDDNNDSPQTTQRSSSNNVPSPPPLHHRIPTYSGNSSHESVCKGVGGELKATHCATHAPVSGYGDSRRACTECYRKAYYGSAYSAAALRCPLHRWLDDVDVRRADVCPSCRVFSINSHPVPLCFACCNYYRVLEAAPAPRRASSKQTTAATMTLGYDDMEKLFGYSLVLRERRVVRELLQHGVVNMWWNFAHDCDSFCRGGDNDGDPRRPPNPAPRRSTNKSPRHARANRRTCAAVTPGASALPDIVIPSLRSTHYVVVEVDQWSHRNYSQRDEVARMNLIAESFDRPVVFVRFNPDKVGGEPCASSKESKAPSIGDRHRVLVCLVLALVNSDFAAVDALVVEHATRIGTTRYQNVREDARLYAHDDDPQRRALSYSRDMELVGNDGQLYRVNGAYYLYMELSYRGARAPTSAECSSDERLGDDAKTSVASVVKVRRQTSPKRTSSRVKRKWSPATTIDLSDSV